MFGISSAELRTWAKLAAVASVVAIVGYVADKQFHKIFASKA